MKQLMILLPVLNEEDGLESVLGAIPYQPLRDLGWSPSAVVVDGNSSDNSRQIGENAGCEVLVQPAAHHPVRNANGGRSTDHPIGLHRRR